tara:strand:+ start:1176 stop:1514 length:339 start_codon:yes stop_codon:yes gene_type:complete
MESSQILQMLADFGALGLASGAIFWLYLKMSKRMDDLTDNFQAQLREQAQGHNDREAALRDRYDKVIATYNDERLEVIQEIGVKLEVVEKEIRDVEALVKEALVELRSRKKP